MSSGFNIADYPVIVGIDFGTTFSGCCYAFAHHEEVIDIVRWPKQHNNVYPKTPTLSLYPKGSTEILDWGYGAKKTGMKSISSDLLLLSKFKLYLVESLENEVLPNGLNITGAIADYLRVFHAHVCTELSKGFASNYDQSKFRYCLTVPAMWSDRAKSIMREAAIRAGLVLHSDPPQRLTLISEPEAAALYCEKMSDRFALSHGQRFMICDAGGGTVDLVIFEIDESNPHKKRTLKEVTIGQGATCGSGFLDSRMRAYITRKFAHIGPINKTSMENIMETFINTIKPEFNGFDDHFLDLPASMEFGDFKDKSIGLENGTLFIPAHELCSEVFEPIVSEILRLIEVQRIQSSFLEAIFLVGGFGQSDYLFKRIEEEFDKKEIKVFVPPRGELAVVRGAVYFGLNPQTVTEHISRRTYGVETRMLFENEFDPPEFAVIGADGKKYCRQRFNAYVRKGQSVKVDECVSKTFIVSYPNDTDSNLYAFDVDGPIPRFTTDPSIQQVGYFPIRMPKLEGVNPGDAVTLTIQMYFGLTEIRIESVIQDKVFSFTSAFDASNLSDIGPNIDPNSSGIKPIGCFASPVTDSQSLPPNGHVPYHPTNTISRPLMYNGAHSNSAYTQDVYAPSPIPNRRSYKQQHNQSFTSQQKHGQQSHAYNSQQHYTQAFALQQHSP